MSCPRARVATALLAAMPLSVHVGNASAVEGDYAPTTVVRADRNGDLYPGEWVRDFKRATRLSADLSEVTYVVNRESEKLTVIYEVEDMRRLTNKVRFNTVLFGPVVDYQRDILSITTIKGKDDPTVLNESAGGSNSCPAAIANTSYIRNRMRITLPFSCLYGLEKFKLTSNTEAYRHAATRNIIGDSTKWTTMLNFTPLVPAV